MKPDEPPLPAGARGPCALRNAAAVLGGLLLLLLVLALAGVDINADSQRAPLSRLISAQIGREVSIQGAVRLHLGLRPQLHLRGLRIGQPPGFDGEDLLQVGEVEIKLDLLALLIGHYKADHLAARDVRISLAQREDGSNNWTFGAPQAKSGDGNDFSAYDVSGVDIRQLDLDNVSLVYQGGTARPVEFRLDKLDASLPIGRGMVLKAQGMIDRTMPYRLVVNGGELRQLLGGQSGWPLALQLDFAGGTLALQGKLGQKDSALTYDLGAPDLAQFGKVIGVKLPDAGSAKLSGAVSVNPGVIRLERIVGTLGKTTLGGWLNVDSRGSKPKLAGALAVAALDLRPFLGQDDKEDAPTDLRGLYQSLSKAKLDLQVLNEFDADLQLGVGQWLSLPGDIRDASMRVLVSDGKLEVPVQVVLERVPMQGRLSVNGAAAEPSLSLSFNAMQSPIGGLAHFLAGVPGIEGQLGGLQLKLQAKGGRGDALMRSLTASMQLKHSRLSYGNLKGGKPVSFTVDGMTMAVGGDVALNGEFKGSLLGRPLTAELSGTSLRSAMQTGELPITLTVQNAGIVASVSGTLGGAESGADLRFGLGAQRAGDIGAWLGVNPQSTLPIAFAGRLHGNLQDWSLSQLVLQVGDTSLYADLNQTHSEKHQRLNAKLELSSVDLQQLDKLLPRSATSKMAQKSSLDIPILPAKLVLNDANVSVRVRDVRGAPLEIGELGFDGQVREGYMQNSPFFAHIAGTRFDGAVMLDLRDADPHAELRLSAVAVDVGRALRQLKLAKNIESTVDRLTLHIESRSSQLATLMANARVSGEVAGGRFTLRDANTQSQLQVALTKGTLSAQPGERIVLALSGTVDAVPIEIRLRSATLRALAEGERRVPFELMVDTAKTRVQLTGSVDRDIDARDLELALDVRGERLDLLDPLLHVALPPWGPWSASGRLRMSARGYGVDDLRLQVGGSTLQGRGKVDTSQGRAKINVALEAPLIQLDDFRLQGWSALDGKPLAAEKADLAALRKKAVATSDQVQGLLSRENLEQTDATLAVRVTQVKSGKDLLGSGSLEARLAKGRAEIGPVTVNMQGGQANLSLTYEPHEKEVLADLKVDIDRFDYGVVGRRLAPGSDLSGRFSLKMDVSSHAPRLSQLLAHGNGRIDVAVWPEKLPSGVFDMWAVNLFVALLPTLDPTNESVINCGVGRFRLNQGRLVQDQLVIDTSRMRVNGSASIDFNQESVNMRLQPQAKAAQFLSLATPVQVSGKFDQFRIGPNPGDLLQTVVRLATSIVWVPLQRMFSDKLPADGSDVCSVSFR